MEDHLLILQELCYDLPYSKWMSYFFRSWSARRPEAASMLSPNEKKERESCFYVHYIIKYLFTPVYIYIYHICWQMLFGCTWHIMFSCRSEYYFFNVLAFLLVLPKFHNSAHWFCNQIGFEFASLSQRLEIQPLLLLVCTLIALFGAEKVVSFV